MAVKPPDIKSKPPDIKSKPPTVKKAPPLPPTSSKTKSAEPARERKVFKIGTWDGSTNGHKIIIYGRSGIGKTSLAAMSNRPVFLGIDDGLDTLVVDGKVIKHPVTGEVIDVINDLETFQDVRDALQQKGLFDNNDTIIIDTGTKLEAMAEQYMLQTIKHEKGGYVDNIEGYGWGKGYRHLHDTMLSVLPDLDRLIRQGKDVVILCQNSACSRTNPAGDDFLEDGPRLYHPKSKEENSIRLPFCEWADHVAKIDYHNFKVTAKKAAGTTDRAVFIQPEVYYVAKSRTIKAPCISFESTTDRTFWAYVYGEYNE